jgi:outer membrane immunogenic protein
MQNSKLIFSAALVSAIVGIGAASAADMAPRTYTKAPVAAPVTVYDWTGFYIGGDVGGAWARTDVTTIGIIPNSRPIDLQSFNLNGSGIMGGVHAGYNWQAAPAWVVGIEGDTDWTGIRADRSAPLTFGGLPFASTDALSRNVTWLASIRGRVGYTIGNWLLYATGGFAWGGVQVSATQTQPIGNGALISAFSASSTRSGWVAGAGGEYALSRNWFVRGEYLFYSLDGVDGTGIVNPFGGALAITGSFFSDAFRRTTVQTVRAGISYKFDSPVVAKY